MTGTEPEANFAVVTDLDGTLLTTESSFSTTFETLRRSIDHIGGALLVATSRSPHDVAELLPNSAAGTTAICFDGACVVDVHQDSFDVLQEENLKSDKLSTIINRMRIVPGPNEIFLFASSSADFTIAHLGESRASFQILRDEIKVNRPLRHYESLERVASALGLENIRSVSWFGETNAVLEGKAAIEEKLPNGVELLEYPEVRYSGFSWLDLVNVSVSKGQALQRLLNIKEDFQYLFALGDAENDLSLFEIADYAFAPADADVVAKEQATHVLDVQAGERFGKSFVSWLQSFLKEE